MAQETEQPETEELSDEQLKLHRWRYRQARRVGMSWFDAKQFADSNIDIEDMRRLAARGCPPDMLIQVLL